MDSAVSSGHLDDLKSRATWQTHGDRLARDRKTDWEAIDFAYDMSERLANRLEIRSAGESKELIRDTRTAVRLAVESLKD
jgi:hypothetical protein